jgi:protein SCO1/2
MCTLRILAALGLLVASTGGGASHPHPTAQAHEGVSGYDEADALAKSQAAIGRAVANYPFLDGGGRRITLQDLRGKPVVISMIYTSCYHICPTVTANLARVVRVAREALGQDSFAVLTIGFDTPVDTPDRMRVFAREQGVEIGGWYFVSADGASLKRLTDDLGFSYFRSPKGFDHMIQATILDAEGKVYRQVYGTAPEPPALVEPLKELLYGKQVAASPVRKLVNNVRLFCTVYDPTTGRYHFDYSLFVAIGIGVFTLGATAVFIVRAWRRAPPQGRAA